MNILPFRTCCALPEVPPQMAKTFIKPVAHHVSGWKTSTSTDLITDLHPISSVLYPASTICTGNGDQRRYLGSENCYMGVSKNRGTPKSSILIGFSLINHPFWGTSILGNTHIWHIWYSDVGRYVMLWDISWVKMNILASSSLLILFNAPFKSICR